MCNFVLLQDQQSNTIDKISFELSSGQLLTVIGPIGAGKVQHYRRWGGGGGDDGGRGWR